MINRRKAMLAVGAGALGTTAALAAPAHAQGKRELKLVTTWPKIFQAWAPVRNGSQIVPFIGLQIFVLLILCAFPELATWFPRYVLDD